MTDQDPDNQALPNAGPTPPAAEGGQTPLRRRLTPWGVSLGMHVALAVVLALFTMIVVHARQVEQVTVPAAIWGEDLDGVTVAEDGAVRPTVSIPLKLPDRLHTPRDTAIPDDTGRTENRIELIATDDRAGALAQLGLDMGATQCGPRSTFFGRGGNAHHIVYVVDRSFSMAFGALDEVRRELLISISRLQSQQDFHVILFAGGDPLENPPGQLVPADMDHKRSVADFLISMRVQRDQTNPVPALQRAFDVLDNADRRPGKLIYLLTDGEFPDNQAVIDAIRQANADGRVLINTYLYADSVPAPQAVRVLKRIAEENGGRFTQVGVDE